MKNILVHTCCAPCAGWSLQKLVIDGFLPVSFFYNPNIHPQDEYKRRLDELVRYLDIQKYELIISEDDQKFWFDSVKGHENDKEGEMRCEICFRLRLEKTAAFAQEKKYEYFTTTLTVSPHKNTKIINQIGKELQDKYGVCFLEEDFKKNDGFKKSMEIARRNNLYRQGYCGCVFSRNK